MVELVNAEQMTKAIERAKAERMRVERTTIRRQFTVTNQAKGHSYTVNFFVRGGKRFGHCTCKGGERHLICKHVVAAAAVNVACEFMRRGH